LLQNTLKQVNGTKYAPLDDSVFLISNDPKQCDEYYRNDSGQLMITIHNNDGTTKEIQVSDKKYTERMVKDNTYFGNNGHFLSGCIIPNDNMFDKKFCRNYLTDPNFLQKSNDEIKTMHPSIMVNILKKFMFKAKEIFVPNFGNVYMIYSISEWIEDLKKIADDKNLTLKDIEKIQNNTNLISYLNKIITKINCNLAILNKNYKKKGGSSEINSKFQLLKKITDKSEEYQPINIVVPSTLTRFVIQPYIKKYQTAGGNEDLIKSIQTDPRYKKFVELYPILQTQFNKLDTAMKTNGKSLDGQSYYAVTELLNNLRESEFKLKRILAYMKKYVSLMNLYDPKNEVLNVAQLKKLYENSEKRTENVSQAQKRAIEILDSMHNSYRIIVKSDGQNNPNTLKHTQLTPTNDKLTTLDSIDIGL
jgi:hypothetical protein